MPRHHQCLTLAAHSDDHFNIPHQQPWVHSSRMEYHMTAAHWPQHQQVSMHAHYAQGTNPTSSRQPCPKNCGSQA